MKRFLVLAGIVAVIAGCVTTSGKGLSALRAPAKLTAENQTDPVGLDCIAPRLGWQLAALRPDARNLRQTAYQVLVASSPEKLGRDSGDLWDSGRVASAQSFNVLYLGAPLDVSQRYFWKVRVWGQADGAPTAWSAPATWAMGPPRPDFDLGEAKWIWAGDAPRLREAPPGQRYFRTFFDAPENMGGPVVLAVTGDEDCEVWLNGKVAVKTLGELTASRRMRFLDVTEFMRPGQNLISAKVISKRQGPSGLLAVLRFADGTSVVTDENWNTWISPERPSDWGKPLSESVATAWRGLAKVAAEPDAEPWGRIDRRVEMSPPAFPAAGPRSSLVCSDEQVNQLIRAAEGSEMAWWHEHLAGIQVADAASRSFVIAPEPLKGLDWVKAKRDTPYGVISSLWMQEKGMFCLEIEVPVNTIATVCLPVEHGTAGLVSDIAPTVPLNNRLTFKVGSGTYMFAVPY